MVVVRNALKVDCIQREQARIPALVSNGCKVRSAWHPILTIKKVDIGRTICSWFVTPKDLAMNGTALLGRLDPNVDPFKVQKNCFLYVYILALERLSNYRHSNDSMKLVGPIPERQSITPIWGRS